MIINRYNPKATTDIDIQNITTYYNMSRVHIPTFILGINPTIQLFYTPNPAYILPISTGIIDQKCRKKGQENKTAHNQINTPTTTTKTTMLSHPTLFIHTPIRPTWRCTFINVKEIAQRYCKMNK